MLDVRRLQILVEVVRCGSFTAAARALSYTPSAVSQQIASLEREAGVTLVVRGPRGVVLTDPGRVLVAGAGEVLGRLAAAERELQALAGLRTGRLRLGWFATAGATLMPRAMAEFGRRHPGIRLELLQGDPDECQAMLGALELELALVYQFDLEPPLDRNLEQVPLLQDPLHIGLPPGHPLAGQTLPRAAHLAGFEPEIAFRTDDRSAVEGLVAAGVGVALFPLLTLPAVRPDVVVRPLVAHGLSRQVRAALPPGAYRPPAATAMIDLLGGICRTLQAEATSRLRRQGR
jgi:DNA-binding transcriptional LysR family regulator